MRNTHKGSTEFILLYDEKVVKLMILHKSKPFYLLIVFFYNFNQFHFEWW